MLLQLSARNTVEANSPEKKLAETELNVHQIFHKVTQSSVFLLSQNRKWIGINQSELAIKATKKIKFN